MGFAYRLVALCSVASVQDKKIFRPFHHEMGELFTFKM